MFSGRGERLGKTTLVPNVKSPKNYALVFLIIFDDIMYSDSVILEYTGQPYINFVYLLINIVTKFMCTKAHVFILYLRYKF